MNNPPLSILIELYHAGSESKTIFGGIFMRTKIFYVILLLTFLFSAWVHFSNPPFVPSLVSFSVLCVAIVFSAGLLGQATESVAHYAGERLGGFLNATFGNAAELIIAIFLVKEGLFDLVKASITGSIIGNMLLVLGLSVFVGGIKHRVQYFNVNLASHNSSLMMLALLALFIPTSLASRFEEDGIGRFSMIIAVALIIAYILWLVFSMITHRTHFTTEHPSNPAILVEGEQLKDEQAEWGKWTSIAILSGATVLIAFLSEWFVHTIEPVAHELGLSDLFVGAIVIAIIGNAAEHSAAVLMAWKNRIGASVEISIGSSLQIALFVAPILVLVSFFMGKPMDMVFSMPELIAIAVSVFIAKSISQDGETNWFEGALLLLVYIILSCAFFWIKA